MSSDLWSSTVDPRCYAAPVLQDPYYHVLPFFVIFGIAGNVCMLLTIRYGRLKESPYVYLTCIGIADIVFLTFTLSLKVVHCKDCQYRFSTAYYLAQYFWFCYAPVVYIMRSWHNLLMLSMTVERFIYVRWPMKTRSWCTRERAKKVCAVMFVLSLVSESLKFTNSQISIVVWTKPLPGKHFWINNFLCAPNHNKTLSENRYICGSKRFPVYLQSNETEPECTSDFVRSMELPSGFKRVPQTNESLFSLDCLHQFCLLPQIPESLEFKYTQVTQHWGMLTSKYMNHTVTIVTKDGANDLSLFKGGLYGKAMYLNGVCNFMLAPPILRQVLRDTDDQYTDVYTDAVNCPFQTLVTSSGWKRQFPLIYGRIFLWIRACATVILTVFNVLVVIEVRRANRKAKDKVLSTNTQNTSVKRRTEENRLTFALILLSFVRIMVDVVFILTWDPIARYIYDQVVPPGPAFGNHKVVSDLLHVVEKSSVFYLLAFMNRKFSSEFLANVVYGKLRMQKIPELFRRMLSMCKRATNDASIQQEVNTESTSAKKSGEGGGSRQPASVNAAL